MVRRTVLLVDDETGLTAILAKRLASRGLVVRTAASGEAGLDLLRQDPDIGLAVLDINMPGLDGLETLQALKAVRPEVEAIILTGYPSPEVAVEGMRLGVYEMLTKPCDAQLLYERVAEALAKAGGEAGA